MPREHPHLQNFSPDLRLPTSSYTATLSPPFFTTKYLNTTYQNQGKGGEIVQGPCTDTTRALYGHYKGLVRTVQGPCSNDTKALNKSENLRIRTFSAYILLVCR